MRLQNLHEEETRPTKWEVYEDILKVPYYVIYDRYENQFRGFTLQSGQYEVLALEAERLWLEALGLGLGLWQGSYEGVEGLWLRFYNEAGEWIPTAEERAEQEQQRATLAEGERDRERQEKEQTQAALAQEQTKKQQLRARLLQLGVDPNSLL